MISFSELSQVIELAVSPVFLLAGIAGFLNVLSGRLSRIVDRSRSLKQHESTTVDASLLKIIHAESDMLWQRIGVINIAIGLCTGAGLSVCVLIVSLFLGSFLYHEVNVLIIYLFVFAMLLLISSLILFLREIQLSARTIRMIRSYSK